MAVGVVRLGSPPLHGAQLPFSIQPTTPALTRSQVQSVGWEPVYQAFLLRLLLPGCPVSPGRRVSSQESRT